MEELGRGGRLRGGAAGELVAAAYAAESAHGARLARGLSLADLAHAVALVEGGDLGGEDAKSLLRGLLELHAIPGDEFPWDPSLGDAFNAREAELERRVGRSAAGSRWSLDRARLAELLGCDGIVEHAKDAAWQADIYLELLATLAIAATHQSQLGQDFEIYASQEFGLVELADAHSRASALMPQKKNPYALAAIRTQAAQAAGDLAATVVTLHTGSARTDHFHLLNGTVPRALDEAVAIARLTASVLEGIELRPARFEQIARESFVTAADVADVLALVGGLDYRSAHKVVGRAVRDLVEAGEPPSALTPARLSAAAEAAIGTPVELDEATLRAALDPAACAAARLQVGSSSAAAMDAMLEELAVTLAVGETWSETAREREAAAEAALLARARELT